MQAVFIRCPVQDRLDLSPFCVSFPRPPRSPRGLTRDISLVPKRTERKSPQRCGPVLQSMVCRVSTYWLLAPRVLAPRFGGWMSDGPRLRGDCLDILLHPIMWHCTMAFSEFRAARQFENSGPRAQRLNSA
jgi:hypothetical protein